MLTQWDKFDYVKCGSERLVVTIGESWTWGDSLSSSWVKKEDNKQYRLANVYGGQLANMINADFLNIAEPGQSNLWIADHLQIFVDNIEQFNYKEIIVVVTLTEVGREFQGDRDKSRDYVNDLKLITSPIEFLGLLSRYIDNKINQVDKSKFKFVIGTNFVDSNYAFNTLDKSWVDVIADSLNVSIDAPCYVVSSWVFDRLQDLVLFTEHYKKEQYIEDIMPLLEMASSRVQFLMESKYNYKLASKHPTPEGHALWANYLFEKINEQK